MMTSVVIMIHDDNMHDVDNVAGTWLYSTVLNASSILCGEIVKLCALQLSHAITQAGVRQIVISATAV